MLNSLARQPGFAPKPELPLPATMITSPASPWNSNRPGASFKRGVHKAGRPGPTPSSHSDWPHGPAAGRNFGSPRWEFRPVTTREKTRAGGPTIGSRSNDSWKNNPPGWHWTLVLDAEALPLRAARAAYQKAESTSIYGKLVLVSA